MLAHPKSFRGPIRIQHDFFNIDITPKQHSHKNTQSHKHKIKALYGIIINTAVKENLK